MNEEPSPDSSPKEMGYKLFKSFGKAESQPPRGDHHQETREEGGGEIPSPLAHCQMSSAGGRP